MFETGDGGGAAADVDHGGAQFLFVVNQTGKAGGIGGKRLFGNFQMRVVEHGFDVSVHDFRYQPEQHVDRQAFAVKIARVVGFFSEIKPVAGRQAVDQLVVFDVDFVDAFFDDFFYVGFRYRFGFV